MDDFAKGRDHLFTLSNNPATKFADWVAYEVDIGNFGVSPGRDFKSDPLLDEDETLEEGDYKNANASALNADKEHQAPLASFARSVYWYETNYLSNITPQDADLNLGPWRLLEAAVRNAVKFREPLYAKAVMDALDPNCSFAGKQTFNVRGNECYLHGKIRSFEFKL